MKNLSLNALKIILILLCVLHVGHMARDHVSAVYAPRPWFLSKYEQLKRHWGGYYDDVLLIKNLTAGHSMIIFEDSEARIGTLAKMEINDFFLFPRQSVYLGDPRITAFPGPVFSVRTKLKEQGPALETYDVNDRVTLSLISRGTVDIRPEVMDFIEKQVTWQDMGFVLLKLFLFFTAGIYLVLKWFHEKTFIGFWTTAFLTGLLVNSLVFFILGIIGIPYPEYFQIFFLLSVTWLGALRIRKENLRIPAVRLKTSSAGETFAKIIVFLFFGALFVSAFCMPIKEWDSCSIWALKAKAIFAFHDFSGLHQWGNPAYSRYPPLWPVMLAQPAPGGEGMVKLLSPMFALCLYGIVLGGIDDLRIPAEWKYPIPLLLLLPPSFFYHLRVGYANLALTVFLTKTILELFRDQTKSSCGSMLLLSGVILVRPDGQIYWLYLLILVLIKTVRNRQNIFKNALPFFPAAGLYLGWLAYCHSHLQGKEMNLFIPGGNVLPAIKQTLDGFTGRGAAPLLLVLRDGVSSFQHAIGWHSWGWIGMIFLTLILFSGKRIPTKYRYEMIFLVLFYAGLGIFSLVTGGWGQPQHFLHYWLGRYAMTVVPIMFIIVVKETDCIFQRP